MGFNGVGLYTLNSGGHSMIAGVSTNGEDLGAQYVGADPCNPAPNGFPSNGTMEMSDQTKNGTADPVDYGIDDYGGLFFVAYTAKVTNTTQKNYGVATFSLQGGGFS
jgi:hypothetical protein